MCRGFQRRRLMRRKTIRWTWPIRSIPGALASRARSVTASRVVVCFSVPLRVLAPTESDDFMFVWVFVSLVVSLFVLSSVGLLDSNVLSPCARLRNTESPSGRLRCMQTPLRWGSALCHRSNPSLPRLLRWSFLLDLRFPSSEAITACLNTDGDVVVSAR